MTDHLDTTRRQLGELGVMAAKTEHAERDILERAEKRLAHVQQVIETNRGAMAIPDDPEAVTAYLDAIEERGRLQQVIAQAREVLQGSE